MKNCKHASVTPTLILIVNMMGIGVLLLTLSEVKEFKHHSMLMTVGGMRLIGAASSVMWMVNWSAVVRDFIKSNWTFYGL